MNKKNLFTILFLLLFSAIFSSSIQVLLGNEEWNNYSELHNISITDNGKFGKPALELSSASEPVNSSTDILLDFEHENAIDVSGNYSVISNNLTQTTETIMGKHAALGKGNTGGIILKGDESSIFGSPGSIGSFTISFWLNPSLSAHGENIFMWDSSRTINEIPLYQYISAIFYKNRLEWDFTNVFSGLYSTKDIKLVSSNVVVPDIWAHHSLSFNEKTGLLEYRINGKIEAITYVTKTDYKTTDIFVPILGKPAEIKICSNYTGRIDDFSIKTEFTEPDFNKNLYSLEGGYFLSKPLGPFPEKTTLNSITSIVETPAQTDVQFFVRSGNNIFEWTETYPEWIPIRNNEEITNAEGMWHQIMISLYPDGVGNKTPTVTEVCIEFSKEDPPMAPVKIFADAGDGYVDLSWLPSAGTAPDGYLVYYGEKPGEYLGDNSKEGPSPIDVGNTQNYRINGLKNGKAYYFAISAYSDTTTRIQGVLSEESYARPLRGKIQ